MSNNNTDKKYVTGKSVPVTNLDNYINIVTKAVENQDKNSNRDLDTSDLFSAMPISAYSSDVIAKNKDILELFPDIELAIKIRIASILSPNNMEEEDTKIRLRDNSATSLVNNQIASIVKSFMSNKLDLEKILKEAMFTTGAYVSAIIPEPLLDKIINNAIVGNENENIDDSKVKKRKRKKEEMSIGIFNPTSLKSNDFLSGLESDMQLIETTDKKNNIVNILGLDQVISDNFYSIKSTEAALENANNIIKNKLKILKTPSKKLTDEAINSVFSKVSKSREEFMALPAVASSSNKGSALEIQLPVSSCIPIYPSGEPEKHIGYLILINSATGTPIQDDEFSRRKENYSRAFSTGVMDPNATNIVESVVNNIKGYNANSSTPKIQEVDRIYNKLLDLKIKSVLKDSLYGDIVDVDISTNEAYRVMLSRILEAKQTRLIFIPKELVSYIAFDYRDNGTGKSILEKLEFFANARAAIFFTNLMAKIGNSTSNTLVNADIDEDHPNPKKARAAIISDFLRSRGTFYPSNMLRFNEYEEWAKYAGIQFNIKHSSFGNTEVNIEENSYERKDIDTELEDNVTSYIYYGIGVTKEQIESARSEDFAIAFASRNKMNAKRTKTEQNVFAPQVSELIQRMVRYDSVTYEQIRTIVETNYSTLKNNYLDNEIGEKQADKENQNKEGAIEFITDCLIEDIEFFLPKPEVTDDTTTTTQFNNFKDNLGAVLDSLFTDDSITENTFGDLNASKEDIIKIIKFSSILDYLRNNNHMPYIVNMFTMDKEEKALVNPIDEYITMTKAIGASILDVKEKLGKENKALNLKNNKIDEKINGESEDNAGDLGGDNIPTDGAVIEAGGSDIPEDTGTGGDNVDADNTETTTVDNTEGNTDETTADTGDKKDKEDDTEDIPDEGDDFKL